MKKTFLILFFAFINYSADAQEISYKKFRPCSFEVDLPQGMRMVKMYEESSSNYCDYWVKSRSGMNIIEIHSLIKSRFEFDTVDDFYDAAIEKSKLNITYKFKGQDFFVISGYDLGSGNIVYWKRSIGNSFISDLHIEYPRSSKNQIEPYLTRISKSFMSY